MEGLLQEETGDWSRQVLVTKGTFSAKTPDLVRVLGIFNPG